MPREREFTDDVAVGWIGYTVRFILGALVGAVFYFLSLYWLMGFNVWAFIGVVVAIALLAMVLGDRFWSLVSEAWWWT